MTEPFDDLKILLKNGGNESRFYNIFNSMYTGWNIYSNKWKFKTVSIKYKLGPSLQTEWFTVLGAVVSHYEEC